MKLEVTEEYFDIEQEKLKKPGDILTVSEERGKALLNARVAKVVEEAEKPTTPAKKATKRPAKK